MKETVHSLAWKAYRKHFGAVAGIFAEQIFLRLIALAPLLLISFGLVSLDFLPFSDTLAAAVLTLLLYVLLVLPQRPVVTNCLKRFIAEDTPESSAGTYPRRFAAALLRVLLAWLWALPLCAMLYLLYCYINVYDATRFSRDFTAIGNFLAPSAAEPSKLLLGTLIFFGAILLFALLALYGWQRGVAYDFCPLAQDTPLQAFKTARLLRRRHRAALRCNAVLHFVLCLFTYLLPLLLPYMKLRPLLTGRAMEDLQVIFFFGASILSDGTLLWTAVIFLALYLPFLPYRKLRNAAALANRHAS